MTTVVSPTRVEVITIGDELLLGQTLDTNAAFVSRELANAGFRVDRRATVGDDEQSITQAVSSALERVRIVICTGGLGPTQDDFTKPVVARLFDAPLIVDELLLEALRARYRTRGIAMSDRNISQAEVPRGATVLPNARGTAPGLVLSRPDGRCCILLPGVPHEMRGLVVEQVIPYLRQRFVASTAAPIRFRVLRTTGIAESTVAEKLDPILPDLEPLKLAFLPWIAGMDLRITSWGELPDELVDAAFDDAERAIRTLVDPYIYGTGSDDLAVVVGRMLRSRGLMLTLAESCTGGLLAKRMTDAPGSSDYFHSSIVAYANDAKERFLGVSAATLADYGAVCEQVARELALGAQRVAAVGASIAITGIAGPGGGSQEKPVGLVWIAAAIEDRVETKRVVFVSDREEVRERAAQTALALLWSMLRGVRQYA
jgi:competence/damage-inducible protein CinA-like protein